ncbi:MAG: ROK family transcriptional regulator [Acutalibacteraceae bacterium]
MTESGLNLQSLKSKNRSLILYELNASGKMSRKELSKILSLTPAAVTKICSELIDEGFITEHGEIESTGRSGRKEILISLRLSDKLVFAINAERDAITYSICDLSGRLYEKNVTEFTDDIGQVIKSGKDFLSDVPPTLRQKLIGMGVCIIGNAEDSRFGVWKSENLNETFEKSFSLSCVTENNVKAFALAQLIYGSASEKDAVLYFKWGPGIGSAFSSGGNVLSGSDNGIAEIGHYIVDPGGEKCRCGRYGCLETVASRKAIMKSVGKSLTLEEIAESDDKEITNIMDCKINTVALALANTATIINAQKIVLFGSLFYCDKVKEKLKKQCVRYNPNLKDSMIIESNLNQKNSYIGAAAICAKKFFFEKNM